jgi:hypothetical protein
MKPFDNPMTDDETLRTIRAWAQDNSLPAEEQVKRLRTRVERLEARVGAECQKNIEDHQASTRIFGWLLAACLVLSGLALWYTSYLGARVALKDVCKFVSREAVNLPDESIGKAQPVDTLEGANEVCFEQGALPRSRD